MENTVSWWKGRGVTIYGRVQINNSLLLPTLIYIASVFPILEQVIKEVNNIIYNFLWRVPDSVIRSAVINDYENGGLKVLDFETLVKSLRLAWLKRLFKEEDAGWKCYLRYLLKSFGGVFLLQCDFDPKDYEIDNRFYYELIQFWAEFRNSFSEQDGKTFIIWNNKNIRINGKPVSYKFF